MMFAVLKHVEGRDVGINSDGSESPDLRQTELMDRETAESVAARHNGVVVSDARLWPEDFEDGAE